MTNVERELKAFGRRVNKKARKNLKKTNNDTGKLNKSLYLKVKENPNSISMEMYWENYGKFIDKGVRGAGGVRKTTSGFKKTNNKGKLWKIKAKNSIYRYGKSGGISPKHFVGWAKRKGISPFAVAKAVYHQGIETTNFFTNPFNEEFASLPDEIVEAYGLDVESTLEFVLKK
tara:strand:+ start:1476 stop:1994 length:519 start_codon:yes stop_codon:yes gene_type:complete